VSPVRPLLQKEEDIIGRSCGVRPIGGGNWDTADKQTSWVSAR
jgi:hypothetical protein